MPCYQPIPSYRILGERSTYRSLEPQPLEYDDGPTVLSTGPADLSFACGRCVGCLLRRAADWSTRCTHELRYHTRSAFLTLTYATKNLPPDRSLRPKDLTNFWKLLRHETSSPIKYFACGEYGDRRGRPHYHAILFGHDFDNDKQQIPNNKGAVYPLYRSQKLDSIWKHGTATIGTVTEESADYVARYTLKKSFGLKKTSPSKQTEPFCRMSKGLGQRYYDEFKTDMYPSDYLVKETTRTKQTIPRYYDKKLEAGDPELYDLVKRMRREKLSPERQARDFTPERLKVRQEARILKIRALARHYDEGQP